VSSGWALLSEAQAVLESVLFLRSGSLEVLFRGETGHGSGVTAGFYARLAEQLAKRAVGLDLVRVGVSPSEAADKALLSLTDPGEFTFHGCRIHIFTMVN